MTVLYEPSQPRALQLVPLLGPDVAVVPAAAALVRRLTLDRDEALVLFGPGTAVAEAADFARQCRRHRPRLGVILLRHRLDAAVVAEAVGAGVRDVVQADDAAGIAAAVARSRQRSGQMTGPPPGGARLGPLPVPAPGPANGNGRPAGPPPGSPPSGQGSAPGPAARAPAGPARGLLPPAVVPVSPQREVPGGPVPAGRPVPAGGPVPARGPGGPVPAGRPVPGGGPAGRPVPAGAPHGGGGSGRVVAVFAGKGGVGKSVIATNLAVALADAGRRVCLVDLDLAFGDVGILLQLVPDRTIADAIGTAERLDTTGLRTLLTPYRPNMDVLLAPAAPAAAEQIGRDLVDTVLALARSTFDYVVVDCATQFNEHVLAALDAAHHHLLVTTPELPALKSMRVTLDMFDLLDYRGESRLIVLNRAETRVGVSTADAEKVLRASIAARVPSSRDVPVSVNKGVPIVQDRPRHVVSAAIRTIAGKHLGADDRNSRPRRRLISRRGRDADRAPGDPGRGDGERTQR